MTDPTPAVTPLGYAGPRTGPDVRPAWWTPQLRVVFYIWAAPLAVGTAAFAGGLLARLAGGHGVKFVSQKSAHGFDLCVQVGFATAFAGALLTVLGGFLIAAFVIARWTLAAAHRWPLVGRPALTATLLLASNFAVAFAYAQIVLRAR